MAYDFERSATLSPFQPNQSPIRPHHAPTDPPTLSFIVVFDILYRISNHEFHFKLNSSISYLAPAAELYKNYSPLTK